MNRLGLAACAAALMALAASQAVAQTVHTAAGAVAGVTADGVSAWKGVPFAAPPIGPLRWRPPQPAAPWPGVRPADRAGPACPQPERGDGGAGAPPAQSEDCLTLNIYAPKGARNLPVMVWIHGGAFRLGYGAAPVYDGAALARQGVVLVTINYRLGLLGFFAHPSLTATAPPGEPLGNYGLMDQLAALRWVKANIAAFGGDPRNVTAFGESAGGSSLIYLLANPAAKGLFTRAIVESGGGLQKPASLAEISRRGEAAGTRLGLPADASIDDLRARPAQDWVTAQGGLQGGLGFGPFIDGRLVTEAPWRAFSAGRALDVPLIVGANSNEASVLSTLGVPAGAFAAAVGDRMSALRPLYGAETSDAEFTRQALGDAVFVAPSRWIASATAKGQPSYLYYFSYVAAARRAAVPGANHGSEIPYVFKSWEATPVLSRLMTPEDKAVSEMISACWVSFAKAGQPDCGPASPWPAYDPADDIQMEFSAQSGARRVGRAAALDLLVRDATRPPSREF
ncbi:carboxylesterase family protein [Phenylobacterium sp.]|uniref:carboxylesterase/lipase family protein n=1 Tax=Phenylobacterium sp. TaxID=1871053 RepID=UPI0025D6FF59|nr:carboxylesterase family protein [Phenylobacterium sp.]